MLWKAPGYKVQEQIKEWISVIRLKRTVISIQSLEAKGEKNPHPIPRSLSRVDALTSTST